MGKVITDLDMCFFLAIVSAEAGVVALLMAGLRYYVIAAVLLVVCMVLAALFGALLTETRKERAHERNRG